jgi:streptogramin lyase
MRSHFVLSSLVTAALAMWGCSSSSTTPSGTTDGGATADGGACAATGAGTVKVTVSGLPAGVNGKVTLTGPATLTTGVSKDFTDAAAGSYSVSAEIVAGTDPIVRKAYAPTVATSTICVENAQTKTVDVTYAEIATSNKLWATNANNQAGQLLGFPSASLGATGNPAAGVAAKAPSGKALAFDEEGNLWTMGPTTADAPVARFKAPDLAASGDKRPDRKIDVDVGGCAPGVSSMAFDKDGSLWITSGCANKIVKLTKEQLAADGKPTPSVVISNTADPQAIAFDAAGNLWTVDSTAGTILRYDASRLAASTSDAASLTITPRAANNAVLKPTYLAFDASGNLWGVDFAGNGIYKITPAEQAGEGAKDVVPSVQITIGVTALLESVAFDEGGGLWLTASQGKVARLAPAQLGTSSGPGNPTMPDTIITSADIGSAGALAFYPAPAALPLYGSVR